MGTGRAGDQAPPIPNGNPFVQELMQAELTKAMSTDALSGNVSDILAAKEFLEARRALGEERYKVAGLQPGNGRDMLRDVTEEVMDAAVYLRALIEEDPDPELWESYCTILAEAVFLCDRMAKRDAG